MSEQSGQGGVSRNGAADGKGHKGPRWLKPAVDFGPILAFFVAFKLYGMLPATGALMAATAVALVLSLIFTRRVPVTPLVTAAVVGVFGGLTLWLKDDTFIKLKPTIVNLLFAAVLLGGAAFGRYWLKPLLGQALPLTDRGWRLLTIRFGLFFVAMAGLNELVWRTQSTDFWVNFKVFGILGLTMLFMVTQMPLIKRHSIEQPEG